MNLAITDCDQEDCYISRPSGGDVAVLRRIDAERAAGEPLTDAEWQALIDALALAIKS